MLTKEEEYFNAMNKYHDEQQSKWNKAKEEVKELIHPKYFDFAENNDTYYSEGIVEIEETDERINGYSNTRHCRIKDGSPLYLYTTNEVECYGFESKYEGEPVEYWVWQETGFCEDDYSGFMLLPLLDGKRFWKVGYSC